MDNVKTIVIALLIALGIRTVAYEPFRIPSESMLPTLEVGDFLFSAKFSYGYSRYSIPFAPPLFRGRIFGSEPERGDVAIFRPPHATGTNFIKRVIGLPGDRVQVREGRLYINGERVARQPIGSVYQDGREYQLFNETLPNGRTHLIRERIDARGGFYPDNTDEYTVPEGHVFMMGDNRDESADSRTLRADKPIPTRSGAGGGFHYVPMENLVSEAKVIFFSVDYPTPAWHFWKWPFRIRHDRWFDGIQ